MSNVHSIFTKELLKRTGGKMYYHEDSSLFNSLGWLKDDGSEVMGWGLARLPIAEPGLHISLSKYNQSVDNPETRYDTFPLKNNNAVNQQGQVYTRYEFVKTRKVSSIDREFPKTQKAKSILSKFVEAIGNDINYTEGEEFELTDNGVTIKPASKCNSNIEYWYNMIYYTVLSRENWLDFYRSHKDKATRFHIKRVMADMTACLALHAVGWAPPITNNAYVQQLRNAFMANPKLLTYASYNSEKYLRELAV